MGIIKGDPKSLAYGSHFLKTSHYSALFKKMLSFADLRKASSSVVPAALGCFLHESALRNPEISRSFFLNVWGDPKP